MSSFSSIFDQDEVLKGLSGDERNKLLISAYNKLKESQDADPVKLRQFRDAQKQTMYEYDTQEGQPFYGMSFADWENVYKEGRTAQSRVDPLTTASGVVGEQFTDKQVAPAPTPARQQQWDYMQWEDLASDTKDFAKAATDLKSYPTRLAKSASDLFGVVEGLSGTVADVAGNLVQGRMPQGHFSTDYFNSPMAKAIEEKYGEVIADDPEMYKIADSIMVDGLIGMGFGTAGVKQATKAGLGLAQKAAAFFAPVTSNIVGGRLVDMGAEGLAKSFDDTSMTENERNGAKIALLLGAGLASGITLEPLIERGIKGLARPAKAVSSVDNQLASIFEDSSPLLEEEVQSVGRQLLALPEESRLSLPQATPKVVEEAAPIAMPDRKLFQKAMPLGDISSEANATKKAYIEAAVDEISSLKYKVAKEEHETVTDFFDTLDYLTHNPTGRNIREVFATIPEADREMIAKNMFNGGQEYVDSVASYLDNHFAKIQRGEVTVPKAVMAQETPDLRTEQEAYFKLEESSPETVGDAVRAGTRKLFAEKAATPVKQKVNKNNIALLNTAFYDLDKYARQTEEVTSMLKQATRRGDEKLIEGFEQMLKNIETAKQNSQAALLLSSYDTASLTKMLDNGIKTATEKGNKGWAKVLKRRKEALLRSVGVEEAVKAKQGAKKIGEKVKKNETVVDKFTKLEASEQIKARKLADRLEEAEVSYTGTELSGARKLEILETAMESPTTKGKAFEPASELFVKDTNTVNMGYIEDKYPTVSNLLTKLAPDMVVTGETAPSRIAGLMQSMVSRAGLGSGPDVFEDTKELYKEVFDLWDEVKTGLRKEEGAQEVGAFVRAKASEYAMTPKQADEVVKAIEKAFPDMDLGVVETVTPKGAPSLFDALTKVISVDGEGKAMQDLLHELGHYHFYYALDSESRLDWLDSIQRYAASENEWARVFPGYEARKQALLQNADVVTKDDVKLEYWLSNPAELYAEQFRSYLTSNVLPSVETLKGFGRVQKQLKTFLLEATEDFEKLPSNTQYMLKKLIASPDPSSAKRVPDKDIEEALRKNYFYQEKEDAAARVYEIQSKLEARYQASVSLSDQSLDNLQAADMTPYKGTSSLMDLPVMERVQMYTLEELEEVVEMQSLKLIHNMPNYSLQELDLAMRRLDNMLEPKGRAELVENMIAQESVKTVHYNPNLTDQEKALYQQEVDEYGNMWNSLENDVKEMTSAEEAARNKERQWFYTEAINEALQASGYQVSKKDKEYLIQACMFDNGFEALEGFADEKVAKMAFDTLIKEEKSRAVKAGLDKKSAKERYDGVRNSIVQQLAAMDVNREYLKKLANAALAKQGLIDAIDGTFQADMYKAEAFARMPLQEGGTALELLSQAGLLGRVGVSLYGGLESDPNGTYVPGLGKVRFSLNRFLSNPGHVLMFPYVPTLLAKGSKKGASLLGKNKVGAKGLEQAQKAYKVLDKLFGPNSGTKPHVQDILSGGKNYGAWQKQQFSDLAESFLHSFTPKERDYIGKIASGDMTLEQLPKEVTKKSDIALAVKQTRELYDKMLNTLEDLGAASEDFIGGQGSFINRFFASKGTKFRKAVYTDADVQPIKLSILKNDSLTMTIKNNAFKKTLAGLQKDAVEEGVQLQEGTKLNYYKDIFGNGYWAVADTDIDKMYRQMYSDYEPGVNWDKAGGGYTISEVGKRTLKVDAPLSPDQRLFKDEISDISVRLAAMGEALEQNMKRAYIYSRLDIPEYSIDLGELDDMRFMREDGMPDFGAAKRYVEEHGYIKVPDDVDKATGVKKYGALAGKYIDPAVWDAVKASNPGVIEKKLRADDGALSEVLKAHRTALRGFKAFKTAYVPTTHMNNIVSNLAMGFLTGHNVVKEIAHGSRLMKLRNWDIQAKKAAIKGDLKLQEELTAKMKADPYFQAYQEIRAVRMSDSSQWAAEIKSDTLVNDLLASRKAEPPKSPTQKFLQDFKTIVGSAAKNVHESVTKMYEGEDLLFKMGAFYVARQEGLTTSNALRRAYEAYFDYGQVAPGVRFLRDTGIVPFVTYTYKAIPALMNAAKKHPERLALMAAVIEGIHLSNIAGAYGGENIIEKRDALERATPDWQSDKALGGLIRTNVFTGMKRVKGKGGEKEVASFLDMSRWFPGSDLYDVSGKNPTEAEFSLLGAGELLGTLLCQSPVINLAVEAMTGQNPNMGIPLDSGGDLKADPVIKRTQNAYIKDLFNTAVPNLPFIPATHSYDSLVKGLVSNGVISPETADYLPFNKAGTGLENSGIAKPLSSVVGSMVGVKTRFIQPEQSLGQQSSVLKGELNKEKSRLNKIRKSVSASRSDKQEAIADFKETALETKKTVQENRRFMGILRRARQKVQGGQTLAR